MTELLLTVLDPARAGAVADLRVVAEPGATLAAVTPELLAAVGHPVPDNISAAVIFSNEGVPLGGGLRLGSAPLLDGALLQITSGRQEQRPEPGLIALHVVAGPGAGRIVSLPPGAHLIGRGPECSVLLADPEVSREHAVLQVGPGAVTLHDSGSTHGTFLAGERVGSHPVGLDEGSVVQVGASRLTLRLPGMVPAPLTPDHVGHLLVNRRPHLEAAPVQVTVRFPVEPVHRPPATLPWLVMLLPMVVSLGVAAVLRQPLFLLFALTTPALMAGQYLGERRSGRRREREQLATFEAETAAAEQELGRALEEDAAFEERRLPDLALVAAIADLPGADLWHRSRSGPDRLHVRLGRGRAPSRVRRVSAGSHEGSTVDHEDVAIGLDLLSHGVIGICGPGREELARSVLGQCATLHSPHDLSISEIEAGGSGDLGGARVWSWLRWLPHRSTAAGDAAVRVVLLVDADRLRRSPGVAEVLAAAGRSLVGHPAGEGHGRPGSPQAVVVCLAEDAARLPMECTATLELGAGVGGRAVLRRLGADPVEVTLDLPGPAWSELIARSLAPLRDATPRPLALPGCPALPELLASSEGVRVDDAADVARHWRRPPASPGATIGVGASGPVRVDLRRDGPHALIGGTTGAGKSELLLSLVTALAADRGPDELSFLLVDYKGGAAFQACTGLPHVAGLITDLDPHLAGRALASLQAELRHRERVLAAAGAADIDAYRSTVPSGAGGTMARLVVVVDEFRVLAEELPDFVTGLVRIAAVGRSLGVHLVLATQRPGGVVSPEIRANTALRIALRVRDAADSHDLIETADAASLPASSPGRAIARIGGELTGFQVSSVQAGRHPHRAPTVRPLEAPDPPAPDQDSGPSELIGIVAALRAAADLLGLPDARRPWLPPLPAHLPLRPLLESAAHPGRAAVAVLGLADLPEGQHQEPVGWATTAGHLGIIGGPRSGRTMALVTLAHTFAARYRPDELHLYAIDAAGRELAPLAGLPHCGAVVPASDAERCARLLQRLRAVIDGQAADGQPVGCEVVLLVDGWESLSARWSGIDHGALLDQLVEVLRDGTRHGIHVAVTGGRSLLTGPVSSLLAERLVLRFADPTDAVLAGVRKLGAQPPGRGVLVRAGDPEGCETQVATADFAIAPGRPRTGGPALLRELPALVPAEQLPGPTPGASLQVPIGLGGDDAGPVRLDLDRPGVVLVHGSPGSGRSTALAVIEAGIHALGVTVVRPGSADPGDVLETLASDPDAVVLVDDVLRLTDPLVEQALVDRVRARPARPRTVVVAGPGDVVTAFRGLAAEARTSRYGLVLGAVTAAEAGLLGLPSMHRPAGPRGRGRLVDSGACLPVQLALPQAPGEGRPASPAVEVGRALAAGRA